MRPEIEELRPKLKEILYDCVVEIRATKGAVYVFDGSGRFELLTEYGFRGAARQAADFNDPIVDRCGRGRTAFFVNGMAAEPRFSPLLFEASTDRLLVAPLYARGKLIGFVDMRDKPGQVPFEQSDATKAQAIADRMVEVFAEKNLFGHRFIALSTMNAPQQATATALEAIPSASSPSPVAVPQPAPVRPQAPPAAPVIAVMPPPPPPRLTGVLMEARAAVQRIVVAPAPAAFSESEYAVASESLRALLLIPGAVVAFFSAFGHLGGVQEIASRSTLTDEAKNLVQSKVNVWLTKRGELGGAVRTTIQTPFGTSAPAVTAKDIQKVFTAPLAVSSLRGLYLTVAFAGNPDRSAHELLSVLHRHMQLVLEHSMQSGALAALRLRIAEKIVEPDFSRFSELRRHVTEVAALSEQFAQHLGLPAGDVEDARLVAMVHDAGMRFLDYDELYRRFDITEDDLGFLRQHPIVGAAMVEPLLGAEIARAVLCHHERVDGLGYPNALRREQIPMVSRLVQICDAWVAMTDADGYQPPQLPENALAKLALAAGSQFDAELCTRFVAMKRDGL